jgi:eukaryotic-like serine/threonine-protein kinase
VSGLTGKYRLDTRLGSGGMAEVFTGSTVGAEGFSRRVAIKRILAGFSENPAFAQMFVAEAQISSGLQHPNIVSVLDFDRDADGRLFLVMELVEGKDLDGLSATGTLPFSVVIHVISEVLRGLGYAHNLPMSSDGDDMRGLVHRDVSPHNVLVSWEGAVKVSDFGIAKARAASNASASVFIKGKPQYMSPEQANGQPLDGRSDLFAVGVMLWEMLTGQRLFVGNTTQEVLARMLFSPIAWPRTLRPEIPVDLERIAMRLLERNLMARYATAEDAIADLLACRDAPRGGRDELVAVLAERFPGQAPVRAVRRSAVPVAEYRGGATSAYAGAVPTPSKPVTPTSTTARGATPNAVPIHVPPSQPPAVQTTIRASAPDHPIPVPAMAAETRTLGPAPRTATRVPIAVWIVSGLVLTLLVVLIVVTRGGRTGGGTGTGSGSDAGSAAGSAAGSGTAAVATVAPPDAAPPDAPTPPDAALPPDAAPARPGRRPDARPTTPKPAGDDCTFDRGASETATISVTAEPWALVEIDGKDYGQTPVKRKVAPGCHVVKLSNDGVDKHERKKVVVDAGQTRTVNVDWR